MQFFYDENFVWWPHLLSVEWTRTLTIIKHKLWRCYTNQIRVINRCMIGHPETVCHRRRWMDLSSARVFHYHRSQGLICYMLLNLGTLYCKDAHNSQPFNVNYPFINMGIFRDPNCYLVSANVHDEACATNISMLCMSENIWILKKKWEHFYSDRGNNVKSQEGKHLVTGSKNGLLAVYDPVLTHVEWPVSMNLSIRYMYQNVKYLCGFRKYNYPLGLIFQRCSLGVGDICTTRLCDPVLKVDPVSCHVSLLLDSCHEGFTQGETNKMVSKGCSLRVCEEGPPPGCHILCVSVNGKSNFVIKPITHRLSIFHFECVFYNYLSPDMSFGSKSTQFVGALLC